MANLILSPLRAFSWTVVALIRLSLVVVLLAGIALAGFVLVKGSQPVDGVSIGPNSQTTGLPRASYWEFMAGSLTASRQTPVNCHRTRLTYLTIALPLYPALYTYVALYPESLLARHVQPSRLIPEPIEWRQVPGTWWQLVVEVSILAFTQPQWDFTPAVGERVRVDQKCVLPAFETKQDSGADQEEIVIEKYGDFSFSEDQRQKFRTGELWRDWAGQYPDIFDKDDLRLVTSQARRGYHFCEWLAAILIYQASGYLSPVEKYGFGNHRRKREILEKLISPSWMTMITHQPKKVQNPDLLVYTPDFSDWYFCEVKGKNDRLRPKQEEYFAELQIVTGRPVHIALFKPV